MSRLTSRLMPSGASDGQTPFVIAPCGTDLTLLAELWIASWQAVMPEIDFAGRRAWFLAHVRDVEKRGGVMLCASDAGGRLGGFILLDQQQALLDQIAVAPHFFGRGLGAMLLAEAKRLCPAGLTLAVNADNPRALRFYEKHGFVREEPGVNPLSGLAIWHMRWSGG